MIIWGVQSLRPIFSERPSEDKLRRDKIKGKTNANRAHFEVGQKVRQTIKELGGTMPEDLPTSESIKRLECKQKRMSDKNDTAKDS